MSRSWQRDAPLERQHQHDVDQRLREEARLPALLGIDAHDLVADVACPCRRCSCRCGGRSCASASTPAGVEAVSQSQVEEWMFGSFIQSHWPCRTLWPISMFSRIFATDRPVVPSDPRGRVARRHQHDPRQRRQPPVELDQAADVVRVARAEVGLDLVVDRLEGARRSPRSPPATRRCSGLLDVGSGGRREAPRPFPSPSTVPGMIAVLGPVCGMVLPSQLDLDVPLRGVDAGAHDRALLAVQLAGAQVAHLPAAPAGRRRCGRSPSGSRTAAPRRPARRRPAARRRPRRRRRRR